MDYINSNRLLFILASPAAGGYRLGRIVSCCNNVHWYSSIDNGIDPWNIFYTSKVNGKDISPYHFDRTTQTGVIPLVGERVEKFWNSDDVSNYYNTCWNNEMNRAGASNILNQNKYLLWVLHDTAANIFSKFPNAKIINLVDDDIDLLVDRYLITTANFPIQIKNPSIKPTLYNSKFSIKLKQLMQFNVKPTYRDFWAWKEYSYPFYSNQFDTHYSSYIKNLLIARNIAHQSLPILNVSWNTFDVNKICNFIDATAIDPYYYGLL